MKTMVDTKEILLSLKKVKEEKQLSIDSILALVEEKEGENAVSRTTIARVFKEGSEDNPTAFRYETTLRPIANALLDIETIEQDDDIDTQAIKSILIHKKDLIEAYERQNKALKDEIETIKSKERERYAKKLLEETKHFNETTLFMSHQIELKDQRIDNLLKIIDKLLK